MDTNMKLTRRNRFFTKILPVWFGLLVCCSGAQSLSPELSLQDPEPPFYTPAPPVQQIPVVDPWRQIPQEQPQQTVDTTAVVLQELLASTNQERSRRGLRPLRLDLRLQQAARSHSQEMLDLNYFSHSSPVSRHRTVMKRVKAVGHSPNYVAENIFESYGQDLRSAARQAMRTWMNSSGHRQNILSSRATHIGIGIVEKNGTVSVTQVFARGI